MIEGDVPATGQALRDLFAGPRVVHFESGGAAGRRIGMLFEDLAEEFASADATGSPVPLWLARAIIWRLARQGAMQLRSARGGGHALFTRFMCWSRRTIASTGLSLAMPTNWGWRPNGSTG